VSVQMAGPRVGHDRAVVLEQLRARLAAVPGTRDGRSAPRADPEPDPSTDRLVADRANRAGRRGLAAATVRAASATPVDPAQVLPVADPLRALLPEGGLRRGSVVAVVVGGDDQSGAARPVGPVGLGAGTTSLLLALVARASVAGSWSVVVGVPALSGSAAAEAGVDLARLALVPNPGPNLTGITAALLDGVDLVAVAGTERLSAPERSRLTARARQRGAVLLPLGRWPGADVVLRCTGSRWGGLGTARQAKGEQAGGKRPGGEQAVGSGGRLRQREVLVSATGRRAAVPMAARLLLPSGTGQVGRPPAPGAEPAGARQEMAG